MSRRELAQVFETQDQTAIERKRALLASAKSQVLWLRTVHESRGQAANDNGRK